MTGQIAKLKKNINMKNSSKCDAECMHSGRPSAQIVPPSQNIIKSSVRTYHPSSCCTRVTWGATLPLPFNTAAQWVIDID